MDEDEQIYTERPETDELFCGPPTRRGKSSSGLYLSVDDVSHFHFCKIPKALAVLFDNDPSINEDVRSIGMAQFGCARTLSRIRQYLTLTVANAVVAAFFVEA